VRKGTSSKKVVMIKVLYVYMYENTIMKSVKNWFEKGKGKKDKKVEV
jgi:hypothetical protein